MCVVAEAQFVIYSCRLVSQSKFLNSSTKDCDFAYFSVLYYTIENG